jgi:predicted acylesterase/phospholipase RssA
MELCDATVILAMTARVVVKRGQGCVLRRHASRTASDTARHPPAPLRSEVERARCRDSDRRQAMQTIRVAGRNLGVRARRPALLATFGLTLALSACVHGDIVIEPGEAVVRTDFVGSQESDVGGARPRAQTRNILVLTSGGADGAFGAGVLAAWTASGKRPPFDVVSGTSTGALQATAAFLGPAYDPVLERIYTSVRTQDILRSNGLKTLLGSGLYDPLPLRRLLMDTISEEMLDAVAEAHAAGRRLYVTTTDMTAGKAVIWDMGAIAGGTGNRNAQYIDILVASAAVPGLIEPVYVRDPQSGALAVHSDGGVKTPVPLESFMLDRRRAARTDVWVVANGHVSRDSALRSEARSTLRLAQRGISQLIRQLMYASVREAEARTRQAGARFHLIALPQSVPEAVNPLDFKPEEMLGLYEAGRDAAFRRFGLLQAAR